ncbi:putative DD34D transposase [Trichonephila clavipes]|nr:putative DD34D transposase [Trichonephila clavipes]
MAISDGPYSFVPGGQDGIPSPKLHSSDEDDIKVDTSLTKLPHLADMSTLSLDMFNVYQPCYSVYHQCTRLEPIILRRWPQVCDHDDSSTSVTREVELKRVKAGWKYTRIYNPQRRLKRGDAAQTVAKPGRTARKVLCIWWDWKRIIYYELPPYVQTLNSDLYCQQMDSLKLTIDQKRPELAKGKGVVFHQGNTRPHTSIVTRQKP